VSKLSTILTIFTTALFLITNTSNGMQEATKTNTVIIQNKISSPLRNRVTIEYVKTYSEKLATIYTKKLSVSKVFTGITQKNNAFQLTICVAPGNVFGHTIDTANNPILTLKDHDGGIAIFNAKGEICATLNTNNKMNHYFD